MKPQKWGLYIDNKLMVQYSNFEEALHALKYTYEEAGVPHELKIVNESDEGQLICF